MKRLLDYAFIVPLLIAGWVVYAIAQSTPGLYQGQVPTAGQWNSYFAAKQDYLGFTPLNIGGGTMQGPLITFPSQSSVPGAGLNVPAGTAPASPNIGDIWMGASGLFYRSPVAGGLSIGPLVGVASVPYIAAYADGVNFNSVADTPLSLNLAFGFTNWRISSLIIQNTGTAASLTTAQYGLFSATGGGGSALIASGSSMSSLTSNTIDSGQNTIAVTPTGTVSGFITPATAWNYSTVYFRITNAQGAAASGNVYLIIQPLP